MFAASIVAHAGTAVAARGIAAPRAANADARASISPGGFKAVPTTRRGGRLVMAADKANFNVSGGVSRSSEELAGLGGDIGARDATAGELESGFNAKSLGEADTEHILKIPKGVEEFTALHLRDCVVLDADAQPTEERQKLVYQKQVIDWKIRVSDGHEVLRREYSTGGDKEKAAEVVTRLTTVAECEGQRIDSFIEGPGVRIELWSRAVNGLHLNDFVMAAKIDQLDLTDVTIKKKPNVFLI